MKVKCLSLDIFADRNRKCDCTNNGISNRFTEILVEHPQGYIEVDLDNPPENLCVFKTLWLGGNPYHRLIPYNIVESKKHSMFGGNFAYSSDSRFCEFNEYPLPIHDRVE